INSFNTIYILDLHGNSKKKEVAPDGSKDENVFDIMQGVAIIIAIKKGKTDKLAEVYKSNIWGKRKDKFAQLNKHSIKNIFWKKVNLIGPFYMFVNTDIELQKEYQKGIKINELFPVNSVGIVTSRDRFVIDNSKEILKYRIENFVRGDDDTTVKESPQFNFKKAKEIPFNEENIKEISYRPFDNKYIYYQDYFIERSRKETMKQFILGKNIGLITVRQVAEDSGFNHAFISKNIIESRMTLSNKRICYSFPLYIYNENEGTNFDKTKKHSNLNQILVKQLLINIDKYEWTDDHENKKNISQVSPLDILDYIYAILHSSKYRETYKELLKIDFPRVPPTKNRKQFIGLVALGGKLRKLHLMEDQSLDTVSTTFSIEGDNVVEQVKYDSDKVWINKTQYFGRIPKDAWEFYIGGYQPAQKWLKDRKGEGLNFQDIKHYQKIIKVRLETIEIMKQIDEVGIL
ncbi:DNA methyltransferase, partial [Candidatus Roizmanbacteria bacterium CG_4_10_14_0_8_um_filter_39_9]